MNKAIASAKRGTNPNLTEASIKIINGILTKNNKVEIEMGRDGIKISEIERTKVYPKN